MAKEWGDFKAGDFRSDTAGGPILKTQFASIASSVLEDAANEVDVSNLRAMDRDQGLPDPTDQIIADEEAMLSRERGMSGQFREQRANPDLDQSGIYANLPGMSDQQVVMPGEEIMPEPAEQWNEWSPVTDFDKGRVASEEAQQRFLGSGVHSQIEPQSEYDLMQNDPIARETASSNRNLPGLPFGSGEGDRHPGVPQEMLSNDMMMGEESQSLASQILSQVTEILEQIKGFSLSPEEMSDLTSMSQEELTDLYNHVARQQGRTLYKDPNEWLSLGAEPFTSPELSKMFLGKVPAGGDTVSPGSGEYSTWNVPSQKTKPGFYAQDYAEGGLETAIDRPVPGVGSTDWMRRAYPWARNLSEDVLQRAIDNPDFMRQIMQAAETNQLIPYY